MKRFYDIYEMEMDNDQIDNLNKLAKDCKDPTKVGANKISSKENSLWNCLRLFSNDIK